MSWPEFDEWDAGFLDGAIAFADTIEASRNPSALSQPQDPIPSSACQHPPWPPIPNLADNPNPCSSHQDPPWPPIPNLADNPNTCSSHQDPPWPPIPDICDEDNKISSTVCFSPPRELSQRVSERVELNFVPVVKNGGFEGRCGGKSRIRMDKEIERLKEELERVSKKLSNKERVCMELQKDRDKKDEQLKDAFCQIGRKDAEICRLKHPDLTYHLKAKDVPTDGQSTIPELKNRIMIGNGLTSSGGPAVQEHCLPSHAAQTKCSRTVGVQVNILQDGRLSEAKKMPPVEHNFSGKLHAIWGSSADKMLGRNLVAELFVTCSADFCVLFKSMGIPSAANLDCWPNRSISDMALNHDSQSQIIDAAKVSLLYELLIKMRHEVVPLQTLLEALFDLCTLENVVVTHKALRILHAILQHLSCITRLDRRNNVLVDQSQNSNFHMRRTFGREMHHKSEISITRSLDLENICKNDDSISRTNLSLSSEMCTIFEKIQQIVLSITEECIQTEALSIMNLILMACRPSEREKFRLVQLLESLSQLLQKEVGLCVQKQAVRLLFLILNCPRMLSMFCDWHRDDTEPAKAADVLIDTPKLQEGIKLILEALAVCLSSAGANAQELKLQRNIVIMLAFIASSGKSGFNVLLHSATPRRGNFLELIIRLLASVMDAVMSTKLQTFCKERASLMREVLILLNRLVSNPTYSKVTLGVLTSSGTASLTVDVANRMTRKSRSHWRRDSTKKMQLEDEIFDLARLFKARVFTFLGEHNLS